MIDYLIALLAIPAMGCLAAAIFLMAWEACEDRAYGRKHDTD